VLPLINVIILAIIQGISEFLPISSSGHLVVADALLETVGRKPLGGLLEVNIVLHLGTLASVIVVYWKQVRRLLGADRRVIPLLIVGTLPAMVIGLPLKKMLPSVLESPLVAGLMFPVTAALLIWGLRRKPGDLEYTQLNFRQVLLIGLFQALAILPGISRSGSTIVAGLAVGMQRTSTTAFAFLLAIPAIAGAGVLEVIDMIQKGGSNTPVVALMAGFVVSMIVGIASLWWLIRWVEQGRLYWFAYWLLPLGVGVLVWQLWGK
jgi:undecaprenyl-diphosphatase